MKPLDAIVFITTLILLSGCAVNSLPQSLGKEPLTRVAVLGGTGLFAADQAGSHVAFARDGSHLLDLESGLIRTLSSTTPSALAWNPDGSALAVAFSHADYETRLALYSPEGKLLQETLLPVALSQMVWTLRGDLLVAGYALKRYSFGGNLRQNLYRIDHEQALETVLSDTTLKPTTIKWLSSNIDSVQPVVFSPRGDELVFATLHDPPDFAPYLQLRHMNWESGAVRSLQNMPLQLLQIIWKDAQESVDVSTQTSTVSLPLWPSAGEPLALPLAEIFRFVNGRLYGHAGLLADWGADARLQRIEEGRFLLAVGKVLYLGDGLQDAPQVRYSEKAWALRRWRFEGLISPEEYQKLQSEDPL